MSKYKIPKEYFFRLHHVRPRFKGDIENVLLFMATEISKLPTSDTQCFNTALNYTISIFPENLSKSQKTINNWRTEISSLFSFFIEHENGKTSPGRRAIELSENQDLVEMFKKFLFLFQYPGGHIKVHEVVKIIEAGISFKPAQYVLNVLKSAETESCGREYITKEEFCHCIFNDLRCTRDNEPPLTVWNRIITNRKMKVDYDGTGDIIRYAGDIIDYMAIANLMVTHDFKHFYINNLEAETIFKFINSKQWFTGYDVMIKNRKADNRSVNSEKERWFNYANVEFLKTDFETDLLAFISSNTDEYNNLRNSNLKVFRESLEDDNKEYIDAKDIGDMGESLVHLHECKRIKTGGREDLVHLIKRIPTQFAVGYDIQSIELDEKKRYIEVKTTISSKPLQFNRIHLTPNEWSTAGTMKDRYFIYRLTLSKNAHKLFIIQDPVGLYKNDVIQMVPRDGADVSFGSDAGTEEILLS